MRRNLTKSEKVLWPKGAGEVKMTANELNEKRTKCEVYSRVVGYIRPVAQWNDGKQAEYADRKEFVVADSEC